MDADSIKAMQTRGLQVIKPDPKAAAEFRAAAEQAGHDHARRDGAGRRLRPGRAGARRCPQGQAGQVAWSGRSLVSAENRIASLALGGIMVIPLAEIVSRKFLGAAIPGSSAYASVLTLWLGMLGAAIAAREGKLLTLATGEFLPKGRISAIAHVFAGAVGAMISTILMMGAIVARPERSRGRGHHRGRRAEMDRRSRAADRLRADRAAARVARVAALDRPRDRRAAASSRACSSTSIARGPRRPVVPALARSSSLAAGILGAPIFTLLGGIALFASLVRGTPPAVLPLMAYQQLTTSTGHRGDPAVHARRIPARRRQVVGAAAAPLPRAGPGGRPAARPSRRRRCARSSRCSPAAPASRSWCWAACCCRRSSAAAIASASRSAC